jgi:hypothetical protein
MATVNITKFTITHTADNADFVLEYDVIYDDFDRLTDIGYTESWYLIGDDTGQDQDDGAPGDNQLGAGGSSARRSGPRAGPASVVRMRGPTAGTR